MPCIQKRILLLYFVLYLKKEMVGFTNGDASLHCSFIQKIQDWKKKKGRSKVS